MLSRWQHYLRAHPRAGDLALALVPVFIAFPGVSVTVDSAPAPSPRWPGYLITGIACAALFWVRRHPRTTAVLTITCAIALAAHGYTLSPLLLSPAMVALAFVALRTAQKTAYTYTAAAIVVLLATALGASGPGSPLAMELIGTVAWLLLAAALGRAGRLRSAYIEAANARAEYAELTREEEAMRRVVGERMRIARELHDIIAHHLALANAQAGTVAYLVDTDPAKARAMAGDLNTTIAAALEDLGTTVGLLRQSDDSDSPLEPAPGLGQLPDLTASFGTAGLDVAITTDGDPQPLPPGTDLTAYRIIQEALTNVTKHSAATRAQVHLTYTTGHLSITITNDHGGPTLPVTATPTISSGYGLIGMRERAHSLGGRLHAAPRADGGFQVTAELPLHPHRPEQEHTS
jgi:signal transduction histidine kinase